MCRRAEEAGRSFQVGAERKENTGVVTTVCGSEWAESRKEAGVVVAQVNVHSRWGLAVHGGSACLKRQHS